MKKFQQNKKYSNCSRCYPSLFKLFRKITFRNKFVKKCALLVISKKQKFSYKGKPINISKLKLIVFSNLVFKLIMSKIN